MQVSVRVARDPFCFSVARVSEDSGMERQAGTMLVAVEAWDRSFLVPYAIDPTTTGRCVELPRWLASLHEGGETAATLKNIPDCEVSRCEWATLSSSLPCNAGDVPDGAALHKIMQGRTFQVGDIIPAVYRGRKVFVQVVESSPPGIVRAGPDTKIVCTPPPARSCRGLPPPPLGELLARLGAWQRYGSTVRDMERIFCIYSVPGHQGPAILESLSAANAVAAVHQIGLEFLAQDSDIEDFADELEHRLARLRNSLSSVLPRSVVYLRGFGGLLADTKRRVLETLDCQPGPPPAVPCYLIMTPAPQPDADLLQIAKRLQVGVAEIRGGESSMERPCCAFERSFYQNCLGLAPSEAATRVADQHRGEILASVGERLCPGPGTWDSVWGYGPLKERLWELVVEPKRRLGLLPPKGILLFGPTGCGKSHMIRAIASKTPVPVIQVQSNSILSQYFGESEANLRRVFGNARRQAPCILVLENIELLAKRRDSQSSDNTGVGERLLSTLLNEMDGIVESLDVVILATTASACDAIDEAVLRPGRLDQHLRVGLPTPIDRLAILSNLLDSVKFEKEHLATIVSRTDGFSVSHLYSLVHRVARDNLCAALPLPSRLIVLELDKHSMDNKRDSSG